MNADINKRLTMEEVAKFFDVSISTVKRWVASKALIAVQASAGSNEKHPRYRFRMQDILAFEESRLTKPDAPPVSRTRRPKPPQILK